MVQRRNRCSNALELQILNGPSFPLTLLKAAAAIERAQNQWGTDAAYAYRKTYPAEAKANYYAALQTEPMAA